MKNDKHQSDKMSWGRKVWRKSHKRITLETNVGREVEDRKEKWNFMEIKMLRGN